ncbi:MAG: amidase [Gemmatimonadota bacterium]
MTKLDLPRRDFLVLGTAGVATLAGFRNWRMVARQLPAVLPAFELEEITISALQRGMAEGTWTARRITALYLERISQLDVGSGKVNSVIALNPDALAIADQMDAERKAGKLRGAMHGVPVLIKDNIDTADRMATSAGSLALADSHALVDATVAKRLRETGAVILGKTNLSEWANFRSTHSSSGWSGRGGQTRNPYALDRNPCGSSSGTGAAVSANFCVVGVGTETDGSIVCPSSNCGLVGIKPTVGLVSRAGIIPISATQDTAGPMARSVTDAAILLTALQGLDPRDRATQVLNGRHTEDYTTALNPAAIRGARIGVARNFFGFSPAVDRVMGEALDLLKHEGAVLVDPANFPTAGQFDDSEFEVLLYEFKDGINAYLAGLGPSASMRTLADLIAFNEKEKAREMPFFDQEIFLMAQEKGPLTTRAYRQALAKDDRLSRRQGIDALVTRHKLDAILAPTGGPAWTTDHVNGDHFSGGSSTPAAVAGYPAITLPAGHVMGLPVGISFFGPAWSEARLIGIAYGYEQASKQRQPPKFLEHAVEN